MSDLPSLLDRAPPLPGLALADLDADERAQVEGTAHPCGEFSAARFYAVAPAKYEQVARALAEGFSLDSVRRVFGIHERTAAAVREREARALGAEQYRGIQARHARGVVLAATDALAERLRTDPSAISTRDLVAAVRELHNVERALEGAPSTIAGVIRADGAAATLAALLDQAAARSNNGFGREKNPAREAGPAPLSPSERAALGEPVEAVALPVGDAASHVPQSTTDCNGNELAQEGRPRDTAGDTRPGAAGDAGEVVGRSAERFEEDRATGAGGVPREQGGPFGADRLAPENFGSLNEARAGVPAGA